MTFPASSLYAANLLSSLSAPTTAHPKLGTNQLKVALYTDSMSQNPTGGSALGYDATGEHATSATPGQNGYGYTTAGNNLGGTVTWEVNASQGGILILSTNAVTTWPTSYLTNVYGCVIYDNVATAPATKPCIVAIKFGTVGSSGGGTFTIDWSDLPITNTIFTIDPTP